VAEQSYGETATPVDEDAPEAPISHYGVAKLAVERYVRAYRHLYGIRLTIFRYANVYGAGQNHMAKPGLSHFYGAVFAGRGCLQFWGRFEDQGLRIR